MRSLSKAPDVPAPEILDSFSTIHQSSTESSRCLCFGSFLHTGNVEQWEAEQLIVEEESGQGKQQDKENVIRRTVQSF